MPQEASEGTGRPQEAPGGPRTLEEAPGSPRKAKEAPGCPRRPGSVAAVFRGRPPKINEHCPLDVSRRVGGLILSYFYVS